VRVNSKILYIHSHSTIPHSLLFFQWIGACVPPGWEAVFSRLTICLLEDLQTYRSALYPGSLLGDQRDEEEQSVVQRHGEPCERRAFQSASLVA
jgi:hypothetical protein